MNIGFFGGNFLKPLMNSLKKDGHHVKFNRFSNNTEIIISESHFYTYDIYKILKKIKKNKIPLINIILDIPPWRLQQQFKLNKLIYQIQQYLYHFKNRYSIPNRLFGYFKDKEKKDFITRLCLKIDNKFPNNFYLNRIFYQINYRNLLKHSDLNLSISNFTRICVKKFLKIDSQIWYPGVNSDVLENIPKSSKIKYDAINISRIAKNKRQDIFANAANKLGLKIAVIGENLDKNIVLNCPNFYVKEYRELMEILNQVRFYVDPSEFEGFGLTPVEAVFLNKPVIASNTYVHREILGEYPIYFKTNHVEDLVEKMKLVINGQYTPKKEIAKMLMKKYSLKAAKSRLLKHIESIL